MYKIILTSFVLIVVASSCTVDPCMTKGQFINGYDTFTEKVSKKHDEYSKSDWESNDEQMDQFVGECYEKFDKKLTDKEKKNFWIKYFKYKYDRHGRNILRAFEKDVEKFEIEFDEEFSELFEDAEGDLQDIIKEVYGDDIKDALDEFKKGIDDAAEMIKEWLDDRN